MISINTCQELALFCFENHSAPWVFSGGLKVLQQSAGDVSGRLS